MRRNKHPYGTILQRCNPFFVIARIFQVGYQSGKRSRRSGYGMYRVARRIHF